MVSASPGVLEQISYVQSWATVPLAQYKKRVPISVKYGQKQMANVLWNLPKISFEVLLPYNFSKVWIKNKKLYFFFLWISNYFSTQVVSFLYTFSQSLLPQVIPGLCFVNQLQFHHHIWSRAIVPIHGAPHCFEPVFHIHFIFLPFLLGLKNHFTLPQFL